MGSREGQLSEQTAGSLDSCWLSQGDYGTEQEFPRHLVILINNQVEDPGSGDKSFVPLNSYHFLGSRTQIFFFFFYPEVLESSKGVLGTI